MEAVDTSKRLSSLRQLMQEHKVDVYSMASHSPCTSLNPNLTLTLIAVVPSEDSHQSEYIAPCDGRRGNPAPIPTFEIRDNACYHYRAP